jgi:regulatory protein
VDTVRSISATRSPGSLVSVTLASGERYQISSARLAELGLAAGDELDLSKLEALRQAHTLDRAEQRLLRLLGTRARSRHELTDRLDAWGVEPERGELLLDRLTRAGLLDDEQFARELSEGLQKRGHGSLRARHDMDRLGVSESARSRALAGHEQADQQIARDLVFGEFGQPPYDQATARRAAALLVRRGFDEAAITQVLDLDPD